MKTLQKLAQDVLNNMETVTKNGKDIIALKSHDIQWHVDLCREAHGDLMPNDLVYDAIYNVLEAIVNIDKDTQEDSLLEELEDYGAFEADCYNHDLLNWVSDNNIFHSYCDEAMQELGVDKDFISIIACGQYFWKREVGQSVINSLNNQE
jgi:hypothetical protein